MTNEQIIAFHAQCEADGRQCLYEGKQFEYICQNSYGQAMLWDRSSPIYNLVSFDLLSNLPAKPVRNTLNVGVGIDVSSGVRSLYIADESTPDTITLTFDIVDGKLRQVFEERTEEHKDIVRWFVSYGLAFDYLCRHDGSARSMTFTAGRWEKGLNLAERLEEVRLDISRELTADEASAYMKKHSIPEVPHG